MFLSSREKLNIHWASCRTLPVLLKLHPPLVDSEFRKFVGPSLNRHNYIEALEWIPRVVGGERQAFVEEAQRSFPPFQIREHGIDGELGKAKQRAEHFPVLYVQPYNSNQDRLGLDLASDPIALLTLQAARDTKAMHVSLPVPLTSSNDEGWGFKVAMPVYRRQPGSESKDNLELMEMQRGDLRGFVMGFFRVSGIVERAMDSLSPAGISMRLYAGIGAADHLYTHSSRLAPEGEPSRFRSPEQHDSEPLRLTEGLTVADQDWQVVSVAIPDRYRAARWSSVVVAIGGGAFTLLLTMYLLSLVNRTEKVRLLVKKRTSQLEDAVIALNQEIGERRYAELQLKMLNDTLEVRVAARTAEAEKRAQELEQFAYVTSHDLKAPLRAISNLAEWIEDDLKEKMDDSTREQLHLLRDRVLRMDCLIQGLLEYSRIGQTEGAVSLVDTAELLAEIVDSLSPSSGFRVHVAEDMPVFEADRLHLGQVFANLISNSLKHNNGRNGNVWVDGRKTGKYFEFSVRDDGPGIAPEYHDKIFKMFQTLETKDSATNTGIGLALVKKIIQEQGGSIVLESELGNGTMFRFTWPIERQSE